MSKYEHGLRRNREHPHWSDSLFQHTHEEYDLIYAAAAVNREFANLVVVTNVYRIPLENACLAIQDTVVGELKEWLHAQ